ncbi:transmembrane protein [Amycolatopsis keratiniphila]|uniref:Transmembrane protein n=1 Tax=Amycolatopsis keratiniphila TaxID=129921 RepID=R4SSU5_9PSEU|nr:transmembrane protein [Amycolatopsis keratiniphila]
MGFLVHGSSGPIARFRRRLFPGRNSLARGSDRFEALLLKLVILAALLAIPVAAAVGSANHGRQVAAAAADSTGRHPATAYLLKAAPVRIVDSESVGTDTSTTEATWTDSRGARHTGGVLAAPGSPAGSAMPIWIDARGELTTAPRNASTAVFDSVLVGLWLWFAVVAALVLVQRVVRLVLDRQRAAAWERAWAAYPRSGSWP